MIEADLAIFAKWIIPVVPRKTVFRDHCLVIKDGLILDIIKFSELEQKYKVKSINNLGGESSVDEHILIPGLFNMHAHSALTLLRGYADDVSLHDWLTRFIWPAESAHLSEEFVQLGTELACAEMIRTGTTYCNEMYFFPEVAADVIAKSGMRGTVAIPIIKFPTAYAQDEQDYLQKGEKFIDSYKNHDHIKPSLGPHAVYTITDSAYTRVKELSEKHDIVIHTHLHETHREVNDEVAQSGMRPIERLEKLGILSKRLVAVHMTHLTGGEVNLLKERQVNVVHCPESNLKLGVAGICPVHQLMEKGVNVGIGTDSAASNDDLDMLGEVRCAAYIDKLCFNVAMKEIAPGPGQSVTNAMQILEMATINGAKALGVDHQLGSLEIGKKADIVAVKVTSHPIYDPISHLVYVGTNRVCDVWVDGKQLLKESKLTEIDEDQIKLRVKSFAEKIKLMRPETETKIIQ